MVERLLTSRHVQQGVAGGHRLGLALAAFLVVVSGRIGEAMHTIGLPKQERPMTDL